MDVREIQLTGADNVVMSSFACFAEGLSAYLGDNYEIVLHSLDSFDHSVIKIINGEHTGRKIGAPITDLALNMLSRIQEGGEGNESSVYFSRNKAGEPLKSTTIIIRGENERIIGLMCINLYMGTPFYKVLSDYISPVITDTDKQESYAENANEMVAAIIERTRIEVNNNQAIHINNKNKEIICILHEKGIFNFKNGVNITAEMLGISKNTVYVHLRNVTNGGGDHETAV